MPGAENPGEFFGAYPYYRVGFAVFQVDVVLRRMLLDKGIFQEQGLVFIGDYDSLNGTDMPQQGSGFNVLFLGKIGIQPVFQDSRFANINDSVFFVPHKVNSRFL
jgi:hypothetical protein